MLIRWICIERLRVPYWVGSAGLSVDNGDLSYRHNPFAAYYGSGLRKAFQRCPTPGSTKKLATAPSTTAATAFGFQFVPAHVVRAQGGAKPPSAKIRIAAIGCGGRGSGAAENVLHAAKGVEIVALGDFDRDGDVDLLLTTNNGPAVLLRNDQLAGNKSVRDTGLALFNTERTAVEEYWFDVSGTNFPKEFPLPTAKTVTAAELNGSLASTLVIDLDTSLRYRDGHVPGAWFAVRAGLGKTIAEIAKQWDKDAITTIIDMIRAAGPGIGIIGTSDNRGH